MLPFFYGASMKKYRIITDRNPFFNNLPRKQNEIIEADAGDEGIKLMLERKWIEEVKENKSGKGNSEKRD